MSATVDSLNIKIDASARGANQQLDKLVQKMVQLRSSVNGISVGNLDTLSNSIKNFSRAASGLNQVKTSDFTRLAKNIEKLSNIRKSELNRAATAITNISKAFSNMGNISDGADKIGQIAQSISRLGYKSTTQAIQNIPLLATALKDMMTELSKAPKVSDNLIAMTNAMANLGAQAGGIRSLGSAMNSAGKSSNGFFGTIKKGISGIKSFATNLRSATGHSRSLASTIGLLYAKFWTLKRAVGGLGSAIESSMNYIEEYNYFNTTMEKIASEWSDDFKQYGYENADAYGKSFQSRITEMMGKMTGFTMNDNGTLTDNGNKNLGLDATQMTNYAASVAQVTNSVGLTGEASVATSKALSMLAGDMSSFRNLDMSTVMNNFSSGLIGQSRALYKYGIDITNATLATYAHELGINKDISAMTQSEKMQLRMIAILDQSKVAWGDLAKTINSPANQLRLLNNNFKALARTVGNIFLPVVAKVLPYINGLVIAIRRLFEWTASMLGIKLDDVIGNSGGGYSNAFDGLEDDADNASSAIDGVADSTDKATEAQKKLNKQLQGFDKLNNMTTTTTGGNSSSGDKGSGSGGGAPIDLTSQLNSALADYEKVWNEAYENMTNDAEKFADKLTTLFKNAWTTGDGSDIGSAIAKWLNKGIKWVNDNWSVADDKIQKIANILATAVNGFTYEFNWSGLGTALSTTLQTYLDGKTTFFDKVDWTALGKGIATSLNSFIGEGGTGPIQSYLKMLGSKLRAAIEFAFGAVTTFKFDNLGTAIGQGINDFLDKMGKVNPKTKKNGWQELATTISKGIQGVATTITTALEKVRWEDVGQAIADFIKDIKWGEVTWKLGGMASALVTAIGEVIDGLTGDELGTGHSIAIGAITLVASSYAFGKIAKTALGTKFLAACGCTNALSLALPLTILVSALTWDFSLLKDIGKAAGEESTEDGKSILRQSIENMVKDILSGDFHPTLPFGIELPSNKEAIEIVKKWIIKTFKRSVVGLLKFGIKINTTLEEVKEMAKKWIKKTIKKLKIGYLYIGVKIAETIADIEKKAKKIIKEIKKKRFTIPFTGITIPSIDEITKTIKKKWKGVQKWWKDNVKLPDIPAKITPGEWKKDIENWWKGVKKWWKDNVKLPKIDFPTMDDVTKQIEEKWNDLKTWWNKNAKLNIDIPGVGDFVQLVKDGWVKAKKWWGNDRRLSTVKIDVSSIYKKVKKTYTKAKKYISNKAKTTMANLKIKVSDIYKTIKDKYNYAKKWVKKKAIKIKIGFNMAVDGIKTVINTMICWINAHIIKKLNRIKIKIPKISAFGKTVFPGKTIGFNVGYLQTFAKGGFPGKGQMFVAREAGPELVGTIGGRTAVMNNNQIVASVSDGVFNALNPVLTHMVNSINALNSKMDNIGSGMSVEKYTEGDLLKVVRKENNDYRKRTGRSAFSY